MCVQATSFPVAGFLTAENNYARKPPTISYMWAMICNTLRFTVVVLRTFPTYCISSGSGITGFWDRGVSMQDSAMRSDCTHQQDQCNETRLGCCSTLSFASQNRVSQHQSRARQQKYTQVELPYQQKLLIFVTQHRILDFQTRISWNELLDRYKRNELLESKYL